MLSSFGDRLLAPLDLALRTVFAPARASRSCPTVPDQTTALTPAQRRESAALMRVNHVGEICAQALYAAQAASTGDATLRRHFEAAAREETDHLAWTQERLRELGGRPSALNPLWYAGAWTLGFVAGRLGDARSLGFVVETERQVEAHLASHLERLPVDDHASRAIVSQMQTEEAAHAADALEAGAIELPGVVKVAMRAAARVMTTTAHYV